MFGICEGDRKNDVEKNKSASEFFFRETRLQNWLQNIFYGPGFESRIKFTQSKLETWKDWTQTDDRTFDLRDIGEQGNVKTSFRGSSKKRKALKNLYWETSIDPLIHW